MENNRVFKFLWRANAVFLFVAGIFLIGTLTMAAFFMIAELGGSDTPPPTTSASAVKKSKSESFELRAGSRSYEVNYSSDEFVYFQLRSGNDEWSKFGSGESSQLRNIAVFDLNNDTTHWVFPDTQQKIENFNVVRKIMSAGQDGETVITGFILTLAKSLDDGSISRDLWAMTPDGKTLNKLLSNISDAPNIENYSENKIKLIIEAKTHIDVYAFDVDTLSIGSPTRVSIP